MPRINCKCCGCPNETVEGKFVVVCEACGTEQVIPKLDSEKKTNLFNRANAARLKCDFEKALSNYEQILIDYPNDPEAHWGIVLCRYGIEYVDDPKTKKKIPTCHRTIYQSIFDDVDYKDAIKDADVVAKRIYQSEAETIDRIQKSIIAISQKEAPYDIFICYKESDENGSRTRDSFVAEDIYNELTQKNYKVFYSRITLESKLGQQYEPIIFAALQSARIMLVIGSKKEYFEAVWVKNEWSRYLSFMAENKSSKYMIPCYRDMEAYDMPDEFLSLQSQNLDRLGAKQDLIRAIDKVFGKDKAQASETKESNTILNLLKRALLCIEDEDYSKADDLLERVLDENPECAEAYTYKILIEKKLHKLDDLGNLSMPLDDDKNYQKAIRFADDDYSKVLAGYNNKILNNLNEKSKKTIYMQAVSAKSKGNYEEAVNLLNKIVDYNDSKKIIAECENLIKESLYNKAVGFKKNEKYDSAIEIFNKIIYYKDSQEQLEKCKNLKIYGEKERIYDVNTSLAIFASAHDTFDEKDFKSAIYKLKSILDYKDTEAFIKKYEEIFENNKKRIDEETLALKLAQEEEEKRKEEERIQEEQRKQEELIRRKAKRKKRNKIFLFIFASAIVIGVGIFLLMHFLFIPMGKYNHAMSLIDEGKYDEAQAEFKELNYSDSANQVKMLNARYYFEAKDYEEGIDIIYNIGGKVDVSYDANGGISSIESQTISKNNTNNNAKLLAYIENTPTLDGKKFTGWVLENYSMNYKEISATLSLKATYSLHYYIISYEMNGGKGYYDYPLNYSVETKFSIVDPYKPGYEFLGWTGTGLSELTKNLSFQNETGDKTFTANWKVKTYTITYDVNGGNSLPSNTQEVTYDSEYVLQTPTRDYYNFAGWYDSSSNLYNDGIWNIDNSVELKARWNPIIYQISYNLNGGTNSSENRNIYSYETPTITINEPTREGYTFLGWTSDDISTPTKQITIPNGSFGDRSFTANWEANDYEVIFNVNGGDSSIDPIHYTYDSNYELPIPTREGYTFLGWEYKSQIVDVSGTWNIPNDCTLTAKWNPNSNTQYVVNHYQENIENDEYTLIKSDTLYGVSDSTIYPEVLTIDGFVNLNPKEVIINPDGSTVVDYYYNRKNNTITFKSNGGTEVQSLNGKYQSKIDNTIVATKENRTFGGWYYDEKLTSKYTSFEIESTNLTLYAKWDEEVSPNELTYTKNNNSIAISGSSYVGDNFILPDYIGGLSVNAINSKAFKNSSSWKKMFIPKSVTSIGQFAFGICTSLEELSISILPENSYGLGYWFTNNPSNLVYNTIANYYVPTSLKKIIVLNLDSIPDYSFSGMIKLEEVVIPNTVTTFGVSAFCNCSSLAKMNSIEEGVINLPSDCETIQGYAFSGCKAFANINMGDRITAIGMNAFSACINIVRINSTNMYEAILPAFCKSIGTDAFYNVKLIKKIEIPDSVTSIGQYAFEGCIGLEELRIPFLPENDNGLGIWFTDRSSEAAGMYETKSNWYVPTSLTKIYITSGTKIPKNAFYGMTRLEQVEISNSVKTIGQGAFYNCSSLKNIVIPSSVTTIEQYAFDRCIGLEEFTTSLLPVSDYGIASWFTNSSATVEGMYTTKSNYKVPEKLTKVVINSTTIPSYSFYGMRYLTEVRLSNSISSIGSYAFYNCENIEYFYGDTQYKLELPESCKEIGDYAFYNVKLMTEVVVPDSVTAIGKSAFYGMNILENIIIPFIGRNLTTTNRIESVFGYIFGYTTSSSSNSSSYKTSNSDFTYQGYYSSGYYYFYYIPKSLVNVTVTVQDTIPDYAFYNCDLIEKIEIPETVTSIGSYAFYNCSKLKQLNSTTEGEVILPTGITSINPYVFSSCGEIEKVKFGDVTSIGSYAFCNCENIEYFYGDTQYKIELPESCTEIGDRAFCNVKLMTEVAVPDGVESIGLGAFNGFNSLESITLPFVGKSDDAKYDKAVFGYIFGYTTKLQYYKGSTSGTYNSDSYKYSKDFVNVQYGNDSKAIWMYTCKDEYQVCGSGSSVGGTYYLGGYAGNSYFYYVPTTLRSITITMDFTIPTAAFNNLNFVENIHLINCIDSVGDYAFQNCNAAIDYLINPVRSRAWDGSLVSDSYHGGTGSQNDPYQIFKPKEFVYFINQVNSGVDYSNVYFIVTSDLDFGSNQIDLIASTEEKAFNGILDGNKHEIRNYVLNATYNTFNGLFGYVSGTIKNIGFKNNSTISTTSSDDIYNGMIVGKLSGRLENVYATGTLNVSTSKLGYTGGLVGYNEGVILNCYSDIDINATSSENKAYAAGLVGYNAGTISGSIAYGNVSAKGYVEKFSYASGLVAFDNEGTVLNSFRYEGQEIMNFDVESESYNSQGESSSLEEIMSYCSENWDNTIWGFYSTRPVFL